MKYAFVETERDEKLNHDACAFMVAFNQCEKILQEASDTERTIWFSRYLTGSSEPNDGAKEYGHLDNFCANTGAFVWFGENKPGWLECSKIDVPFEIAQGIGKYREISELIDKQLINDGKLQVGQSFKTLLINFVIEGVDVDGVQKLASLAAKYLYKDATFKKKIQERFAELYGFLTQLGLHFGFIKED